MKRVISMLLALTICLTCSVVSFAGPADLQGVPEFYGLTWDMTKEQVQKEVPVSLIEKDAGQGVTMLVPYENDFEVEIFNLTCTYFALFFDENDEFTNAAFTIKNVKTAANKKVVVIRISNKYGDVSYSDDIPFWLGNDTVLKIGSIETGDTVIYYSRVREPEDSASAAKDEAAGEAKLFCRECGQELAADARFCSNCGTEVITVEQPAEDTAALLAQIADLESQVESLEEEVDVLKKNNETYKKKNSELTDEVNEYKNSQAEDTYSALKKFCSTGKDTQEYDSYYPDRHFVVVRKGESEDITIRFTMNGYSIYYDNENPKIATAKWTKEWSGHNTTCRITGNKEGHDIIKFTRDGSSDTFYVFVIVVP